MPFTPAHAVVALPFVRTPLLPAAIAIGAMTPDLPLFVRGTPLTYHLTHSDVTITTLVALGLLALWYLVLRPAIRELSPAWLARRLPGEWDAVGLAALRTLRAPRPGAQHAVWRETAVFAPLLAVSLLLGVVSHIVWDAFTHEGRGGLDLFPVLSAPWGPMPGYKWLQHGSSVLGLVVIAVCAVAWLARRRAAASIDRVLPRWIPIAWMLALPAILTVAWCAGVAWRGPFTAEWTPQHLAYLMLPPACAIWGALTFALCVSVVVLRLRRPAGAARGTESE